MDIFYIFNAKMNYHLFIKEDVVARERVLDRAGAEKIKSCCLNIAKHLHQPKMLNGSRVLHIL